MRNIAAGAFYVLGLAGELCGILVVWSEARQAQRVLADFRSLNPEGHQGGSLTQIGDLQPVIVAILGNQTKRRGAIVALIGGVVAGALGNFLSL
jgi:hypothetical protein